jgi:Rhs element Vgr protein
MNKSPNVAGSGNVTFSIKKNGNAITTCLGFQSVFIYSGVNRIPFARINIEDGNVVEQTFPVSDSDDFKPGVEIEIFAGYKSVEVLVFSGVIVKHNLVIQHDGNSKIQIECKDKCAKMTVGRKNANYLKKKDSDILTTLIQNAGLTADVEATTIEFEELVQYYCTDWDFLLSRAEVNGLITMVESGKISVKKPATSEDDVLTVTYGIDIIEFNADINATAQLKKVKGVSWDIKKQEITEAEGQDPGWDDQGNISRTELAKILSPDIYKIHTSSPLEKTSMKGWADAKFVKSNLSKITGTVKFAGSSKAKLGKVIKLVGVGERFEGKVLITGVTHEIQDNNWTTECEFGLTDDWFINRTDIVAPLGSGFLPGVEGLHIGKVMKLDEDPLQQSRIKVKLPVLQTETEGVWARLAQFYGTNASGSFFIPEIDDEVIVGYFNNDPSQPVILGSLYSSKITSPYKITKENFKKAIISKEKLTVEFDDENKVITIKTPGNNSVIISDKDKKITISDQNNNKLVLSSNGIEIDSAKDIKMSAKGKIEIAATGALNLSSTVDTEIKGNNVNIKANIGAVVKGSATAEISASGQTTVKGAMVMIN